MKFLHVRSVIIAFLLLAVAKISAQETIIHYLSGTGNNHTVNWQFYCTEGMNAGKWANISVPSCWELQGFGKYDYGFAKDNIRGKEKGCYKYEFNVPTDWKNKKINIVFEGVMTDAEVKINGHSAGDIHQGAFYSFKYDITKLLNYGAANLLEVTVSKQSANASVNAAERKGDFWIFGGIFRPVFLEVLPQHHIASVSIDAKANGQFKANLLTQGNADKVSVQLYTSGGVKFGASINKLFNDSSSAASVSNTYASPKLWSSESPDLYKAIFTLYKNGKPVHQVIQKFGFRTVEVKPRDGIYVNGVKMKFKGVNHHSFWPSSGRTTSKEISLEDVLLMKDMNMNAVRMSHYPPDAHFLDVCDSLGLFVMDELTGWHGHYDTLTGTKLVKEMLQHDVNHPCIILWSNGNEGGHNLALDHVFKEQDIQQRTVVHPWQLFNGIETQHYREYNYGIGNYENGHEIVMPTEFLHGLYDGGHGAGLEDYWDKMWHNPLSAGGFLWDFADEGVLRTDKNGMIDTDGDHGADGIIGPYHEKEGSYFAIKEIWSPIFFEKKEITASFDGRFNIENRYQFTNSSKCSFSWKLKHFDLNSSREQTGHAVAPSIKPNEKGILLIDLPANWKDFDVLYITVKDIHQQELFTWSFPITLPTAISKRIIKTEGDIAPQLQETDSLYQITVKDIQLALNKNTGIIRSIQNPKGELPFNSGPIIQEGVNNFQNFTCHFEGKELIIQSEFNKKKSFNTLQWTIYPSGWIKMKISYFPLEYFTAMVGVNFSFPETKIEQVTYMGKGPYRVWKNRIKGGQFGVFTKKYNNTETGETWNYPEFKGYYANFYGGFFSSKEQRFTVATENEDLFLRLFTPAFKTDQWHNYEPTFPAGDISFMQGIPAIGTKTQRAETTGPMGGRNIFYDYEKDPSRALEMVLYFNFSGK